MPRAQGSGANQDKKPPAPRPSLRAEQVEATRHAIVASARRLFGANGYSATSVDDIARDARVTKGAVYHHFDTKEALFRAVYSLAEEEAQERTALAPEPEAPLIDQLVQGMQGYLDATLDPDIRRITLIDGPAVLGPEPEGPTAANPRFMMLRAVVAEGIRQGAIAELDPDALAHLIGGACLQAGLVIARAPDPVDARQRVGAVVEAMIRGLAPAPAAGPGAQPGKRPTSRKKVARSQ